MSEIVDFSILKGLVFSEIETSSDSIIFTTDNNDKYMMHHQQDCCERVEIESITGDLFDLVGNPILIAEESTNEGDCEYGTATWTFYKLATIKGHVDIRWYGTSNGYYSESVRLTKLQTIKE